MKINIYSAGILPHLTPLILNNLDHNFITDYSETSDNRPYITSNISPETTPEEQLLNVVPQYIKQHSVQLE